MAPRSVRVRVGLLVVVPLIFLIGLFSYLVVNSASSVLTLNRSKVMMDKLGQPITALQQAMSAERARVATYYARPLPTELSALQQAEAKTNGSVAAFRSVADSSSVRQSASPAGKKAIAQLLGGIGQLTTMRSAIPSRSISPSKVFKAYSNTLAASYGVLEQAIIQEGNSSQVLPGIAVIELDISTEYLQQESALLNGDFAAGVFPPGDHRNFVSLVGAHRLLYAQSLAYLVPADQASLKRDVSPANAKRLVQLENMIVADRAPAAALPPVHAALWNQTVNTYTTQVQQAVGQAEARLAAGARAQATDKLHTLLLTGGIGLAGVILSVAITVWIAAGLTRQLSRLRASALELANVQLPQVVRRLRAGQDVDVDAEVPALRAQRNEIGQVSEAFNEARRTAVEAAVYEARLRRGINDVFRNLAKRSQSLLHRQMALLDALERKENDPDNLQGLFRIDHLTTRMRRHAESLVILAGDAPSRGWRNPVPFVDVLRAAAAEVEDYTRIKVITNTSAALHGPAVADVIHLIAELAENATLYSPEHTQVRIVGELVGTGYAIDIEDRGLGMSDEDLAVLNDRLANPPDFDLSGSDRLGIFVAARLARRHGISVSLTHSLYGGTTAIVIIPMELVTATDGKEQPEPESVRPLLRGGRHALAGLDALPAEMGGDPVGAGRPDFRARNGTAWPPAAAQAADRGPADPHPAALAMEDFPAPDTGSIPRWPEHTSSEPAMMDTGERQSAPSEQDLAYSSGPLRTGEADGLSAPEPEPADPTAGLTENGLPQRVRRASLAPQLRHETTGRTPGTGEYALRDPEVARTVMSAFHRGWRQGLSEPGGGTGAPQGLTEEDGQYR